MPLLRALIGLALLGLLTGCLGNERPPLQPLEQKIMQELPPWYVLGAVETNLSAVNVGGTTSWGGSARIQVRQMADTFEKVNEVLETVVLQPVGTAGSNRTLLATVSATQRPNYWEWTVAFNDTMPPADKPLIRHEIDEKKNTVLIDSNEYNLLLAEQQRQMMTGRSSTGPSTEQRQALALVTALRPVLSNPGKRYLGTIASEGQTSDFALTFTSFDEASNRVEGEVEYPRLQMRAQISGTVAPEGMTLTEGASLAGGGASGQPRCTFSRLKPDGSELLGEAACSGARGTVAVDLQ